MSTGQHPSAPSLPSLPSSAAGELDLSPSRASGSPDDARIGSVIGDKYTVVRLLGRGGMGSVYEARHVRLARRFALKFLLPEVARNADMLRRFENEAKAAGGLEHPNLAAVTDFGRAEDGTPYLVMEFLEGEDCLKLLRRVGPLPVLRAVDIVIQACRGLAVAHKAGIVHRDIKPGNLFLSDAGDGTDRIKVLDFGIAKLRSAEGTVVTSAGTALGTASYMSPEQARGAADVDERTDVWSLGVVLYELLSGRSPFVGERFLHVVHQVLSVEPTPLAALRPGLPRELVAVVERAMTKNAAERLPTASALARALTPFSGRTWGVHGQVIRDLTQTQPTPLTAISPRASALSDAIMVSRQTIAPLAEDPPQRPSGKLTAAAALAVVALGTIGLLASRRVTPAPAPAVIASGAAPGPSFATIAPGAAPQSETREVVAAAATAATLTQLAASSSEVSRSTKRSPGLPTTPVPVGSRSMRASPPALSTPAAPSSGALRSTSHPIEIDPQNPY